jgi:hypothetical protein
MREVKRAREKGSKHLTLLEEPVPTAHVRTGVIKRLEHTTVSTGEVGDNRQEAFSPKEHRRLLRELAKVRMWHIEEARPRRGQRWPTISYEVTSADGVRTFGRPNEAWEYFQKLTNAPDKMPEPPRPPVRGT